MKTAGFLAIGPLGSMAGGPENHFSDSHELYVLVEGDEWAHMEALDSDAGYWARRFAKLVNWRARGEKAVHRAVVPPAVELVEQLKEIARLRAEGALTESEFEAVKAGNEFRRWYVGQLGARSSQRGCR